MFPAAASARYANDSRRDTSVPAAVRRLRATASRWQDRGPRISRRSMRGGSSPTLPGNSVPRGHYFPRPVRDVARHFPASRASRVQLESFCAWEKLHRFYNELLVAAIQHQITDLGDLTLDDGVMFAH